MKLPRTINIFGETYKIQRKLIQDMGWCEPHTSTITINKEINDEKIILETLFHECVHAIFFRAGLNQKISVEFEEVLCEMLSKFIVEEVLDRPKNNQPKRNKKKTSRRKRF